MGYQGSGGGSATTTTGSATTTTGSATVPAPTLTATLSSATLEEDCGAPATSATPAAKAELDAAKHAKGKSDRNWRSCVQSEMMLQVRLDGGQAGSLQIARAELQASDGTSLGALTAREGARWDEATSAFVAWDGAMVPGVPLQVRYALSAPATRHPTYTLRVTVQAVLVDGTVVSSAPLVLEAIAREPMVKT